MITVIEISIKKTMSESTSYVPSA